jgi:hypothetical protein
MPTRNDGGGSTLSYQIAPVAARVIAGVAKQAQSAEAWEVASLRSRYLLHFCIGRGALTMTAAVFQIRS